MKKAIVSLFCLTVLVISCSERQAQPLSEDELLLVIQFSKYGYMDRTGKIVIPSKFYRAGDFSEGLAKVQLKIKQESWLSSLSLTTPGIFQMDLRRSELRTGLVILIKLAKLSSSHNLT